MQCKTEMGLAACIGCNACMKACPVADPELTIADLNHWTAVDVAMPGPVQKFTVECFQCGLCVPVCPSGVERDTMMLWMKHRLPEHPPEYEKHLKHKGAGQSVTRQLGITMYNLKKRPRMGSLGSHVDKGKLRVADTLFFFGCNIYSDTGLPEKVLALADYLKCDYEVLGGLRSCCGWPHYLAGEFDRAEALMDRVYDRVLEVRPKEVVTIGAECYAALRRVVAVKGDLFTPVTAASWVRRNLHRFPLQRIPQIFTFHDACHVTRKLGEGEEARRVLRQIGGFVEMEANGDDSPCCGHYQFEVNPEQVAAMRNNRLEMARQTGADRMVVECVRCQESFGPAGEAAGIPVVDLVDLVYEAIDDDSPLIPQPVHFRRPLADDGVVGAEGA
ncbi:MAG: (Fe-S)-binding protein [Leptospirillia bacterium]